MGQYSIKDIEQLTGVKAHTIRIWEQRYGLVVPHRTQTNIRYYDDEQLKRLLNVAVLMKNGRKISHISRMSESDIALELKTLLKAPAEKDQFFENQVDYLTMAMLDLDENRFEKVIANASLRYGFESTMIHIIIPFLHKVGLLWATDEINVAQEHFISNLIRRKLIVAIDAQIPNYDSPKKFLFFLPEGELHELGLLFAKFLAKSRGYKSLYLGQTVPLVDVLKVSKEYNPDYLLTYFTGSYDTHRMKDIITELAQQLPDKTIIICGPLAQTARLQGHSNLRYMTNVEDLTTFLAQEYRR